ncbi:hypothetical protein [Planktotalea sp.]|uniref:hypothetical protein n=1 Tax=Planktotalea sp. TaxID=2029877 RepID=UPI0025E198A2|nr:hypothetical protein [Planktotalea sp.]
MSRKSNKRTKLKSSAQSPAPHSVSRRLTLKEIALYALGGAAITGGGVALAADFQSKLIELDLSVIGQGTPVILQIHDPQCSMCAALQKQTRIALKSLEADAVLYRVANISTEEGAAQQRLKGLPHVTLVLYNGEGVRQHVIQGVTPAADLLKAFQQYLKLPLA